ncbi:STAS-like domain-containing protein [Leptospira congkakensis]
MEGNEIFEILLNLLETNENISISFKGLGAVSSSFVNSAFIRLLDKYSFNEIQKRIKFIDTLKIHNNLIKQRFQFETSTRLTNTKV